MSKSMKDLVAEARSHIDTITPAEARNAMQRGDLILDVREPAELEGDGAIEYALQIPRGLVEAHADTGKANATLTAKRGANGRIHVLCASGARAALAAESLRQMGFDTTVIEGGLEGWKRAGLPLRT